MARRKTSGVLDALNAFQQSYGLARGAMQDSAMSEANQLDQTTDTTATMAEQAPPADTVYDEDTGQYLPKYDFIGSAGMGADYQQPESAGTQPKFDSTAKTSYGLAGQTQDAPFSQAQIEAARNKAQANVYRDFGKPEEATKLEHSALQAQAAQLAIDKAIRDTATEQALSKGSAPVTQLAEQQAAFTERGGAQGIIDEAQKASDADIKAGVANPRQPLDKEQKESVTAAYGLSSDPGIKYILKLNQAAAYQQGGKTAEANAITERATQEVAGAWLKGIDSGDEKAVEKLYNLFPNGQTLKGTTFDPTTQMFHSADQTGRPISISQDSLRNIALSKIDPFKASHDTLARTTAERDAKHKADVLAESKRQHAASEANADRRYQQSVAREERLARGKAGSTDVHKLLTELKAFGDDSNENMALADMTQQFVPGFESQYGPGDAAGRKAALMAKNYMAKRQGFVASPEGQAALKGVDDPTQREEVIQNKLAPVVIDYKTGQASRIYSAGGTTASYGVISPPAPAVLHGPDLEQMIADSRGKGIPKEQAKAWDDAIAVLPPEVRQQWSAAAIAKRYGGVAKAAPAKPDATKDKPKTENRPLITFGADSSGQRGQSLSSVFSGWKDAKKAEEDAKLQAFRAQASKGEIND